MIETNKFSRREFVKRTAVAGAGIALLSKFAVQSASAMNNSDQLGKWMQGLRGLGGPGGIQVLSSIPDPVYPNTDFYQVTAAEFTEQLHPKLPATTLWGYRDSTKPATAQTHLGGLIVARRGRAARIRFTNSLPTTSIIPNDLTLPGVINGSDRIAVHLHGGFIPWMMDGGPFHWWNSAGVGAASFINGPGSIWDNMPQATVPGPKMLPGQADYFYPNDQSCRLLWYHDHAHGITRTNAYAGLATGYLILDAINDAYVAAGKIPGAITPLVFQDKKFVSATTPVTDPTWAGTAALPGVAPLRVQGIGSLWYEHVYSPKEFRLLKQTGLLPLPDPSCIPEYFGDTMLTNGTVYPVATVEAKRNRFMILNACNARFLNINLLEVPATVPPAAPVDVTTDPKTGMWAVGTVLGPPITQIGTEGGFLMKTTVFPNGLPFNPATFTGNLLLAPAERADIVIDFTGMAGKEFMFYNDAPGPFPAGPPTNDYYLGNPKNPVQPLAGTGPDTRNILRFKVIPAVTADPVPPPAIAVDPTKLDPPSLLNYATPVPTPIVAPTAPARDLTLNEAFDLYGRLQQLLGTTMPFVAPGVKTPKGSGAAAYGRDYLSPATEVPVAGTTEIWNIYNITADTHPIHFHLVNVQVISRQPFKIVNGVFTKTGVARGPQPNEIGWKETVQMHPGEVTSVIMKFDVPAAPFRIDPSPRFATMSADTPAGQVLLPDAREYVWHCHILEHEEHDMMRPIVVTGSQLAVTTVQEVAVGGTGTFFVSGAGTAAWTVTPPPALPAPAVAPVVAIVPANTTTNVEAYFTVTAPAGTVAGTYQYTVKAGAMTAIAKLVVA